MKFTFGIITCKGSSHKVDRLIQSIRAQNIFKGDHEIIVVGDYCGTEIIKGCIDGPEITLIPFDDSQKPKPWITKKKNLIAQRAKFENLCLLHDYVCLKADWYRGMCEYGNHWDMLSMPLEYEDGRRAIDHLLAPYNSIPDNKLKQFIDKRLGYCVCDDLIKLPYDIAPNGELSKYVYAPGNAFCIKTWIMRDNPLDETLLWDDSEDLEFCRRVSRKYTIKLNTKSGCRFKSGGRAEGHRYATPQIIAAIKEFIEKEGLK